MLNEFREDLVSGEWVLFASGRAQRPEPKQSKLKFEIPKDRCPFEDPEKSGNVVVATYLNKEQNDWIIKVAKNKYPAVLENGGTGLPEKAGPFNTCKAVGRHEVIVFRDHDKHLHDFSKEELAEAMKIYQERYLSMLDHDSSKYILIFHNHGFRAGATVAHPHSQIMSIPVLPPDVKRSINGSERYYNEHKKRIYDVMIDWEIKEKKRIIYENDYFIALCPFVSKTSYEIRIFPRESHAHFEKMPDKQLIYLGETLRLMLQKINKALDNPDYNFFIHTAPLENMVTDVHEFYTWHIEILPKISTIGAFELGSGVDVNVVDPDEAAKLFKETEV